MVLRSLLGRVLFSGEEAGAETVGVYEASKGKAKGYDKRRLQVSGLVR